MRINFSLFLIVLFACKGSGRVVRVNDTGDARMDSIIDIHDTMPSCTDTQVLNDAGSCVAKCNPANETVECGIGQRCQPDGLCKIATSTGRNKACQRCNVDDDCEAEHRCFRMTKGDSPKQYCLPIVSAPTECTTTNIYSSVGAEESSVGSYSGSYCTINESALGCPAITDVIIENRTCTANSGCSEINGGLCLDATRCTYRCTQKVDAGTTQNYQCPNRNDCIARDENHLCDLP